MYLMMLIKHRVQDHGHLERGLSGDGRGKRIRPLIPGYGVSRKKTSPTVGIREGFLQDATLQMAGL